MKTKVKEGYRSTRFMNAGGVDYEPNQLVPNAAWLPNLRECVQVGYLIRIGEEELSEEEKDLIAEQEARLQEQGLETGRAGDVGGPAPDVVLQDSGRIEELRQGEETVARAQQETARGLAANEETWKQEGEATRAGEKDATKQLEKDAEARRQSGDLTDAERAEEAGTLGQSTSQGLQEHAAARQSSLSDPENPAASAESDEEARKGEAARQQSREQDKGSGGSGSSKSGRR